MTGSNGWRGAAGCARSTARAALAAAAMAGCAPTGAGVGAGPDAAPALREEMLASADWLAQHLNDPAVVVLHVGSERAEFEQAHLPGARFLPVSAILAERDGNINEVPPVAQLDSVLESVGVSDGGRVVVYGSPLAAARAFFTLDYLGHGERTALLDGGLPAWRAAGRAVTTAEPAVVRGSFTPRPAPQRVVEADWVLRHLRDPAVALVDARPEPQYTGADPGAGIPRGGHIPGAGSLFWERLIHSTAQPTLRDPASLRALFREAGVEPGDLVVTYCRSGMQASFAYFVARYLGYDTRMYDGSFADWSRRAELPVER